MSDDHPPPRARYRGREDETLILVPHVEGMLRPETQAWAKGLDATVALPLLDRTNTHAYGEMLYQHWAGQRDLVIVEQDVVPPDHAVERFNACSMPWCTHPYLIEDYVGDMVLGCTRFTARLQRQLPHLMWHAARNLGGLRQPTPWYSLNEQIIRYLQINRIPVHPHTPPATHLHDYRRPPNG